MNHVFKLSAVAAAALMLGACQPKTNAAEKTASSTQASAATPAAANGLDTPVKQASYAIGADIGRSLAQMKKNGTEIDLSAFNEAVQTMIDGKEPKMNEQQVQETLMKFMEEQQQKAQAKQAEDAKINLEKGQAFLKENATKEGVKTTASGLQYKVKTEGSGAKPKATDTVTVEYEGRLIDGTVFDTSKNHGGSATFPLNQVIPGWTEGVQLMKEGAEYTFYVPAKLAYGDRAASEQIGPNSTLIFDVKLVKVEKTPAK